MLHLSTDCSIVMGAGGSPRVGSASMDEIKLTAELLAEGWSSAELDRLARSGEVQRIRRGAYECGPTRSLDLRDQHRRLIAATVRQTAVDAAVSHMSAAVLHQLPIWNNELERMHITRHQNPAEARSVAMSISMRPRWLKSMFARSRVNGLPRSRGLSSICCGPWRWSGQCPSVMRHLDWV